MDNPENQSNGVENQINLENSLETEYLAYLMFDPRYVARTIGSGITEEYFDVREHKTVFSVAVKFYGKTSKAIEPSIVLDFIRKRVKEPGKIVRYQQVLDTISGYAVSDARFTWVLSQLRDQYKERILRLGTIKQAQFLESGQAEKAMEVMQQSIARASEVSAIGGIQETVPVNESVVNRLEAYNEREKNPDKARGIFLGVPELDDNINGLRAGMMMLLAARPKTGKSITMVNYVYNVAVQKKNVVIFSIEMDAEQYTRRWDACCADINYNNLRDGKLSPEDKEKYKAGLRKQRDELGMVDIVDTRGGATPAFVRAKLDERERILNVKFDIAFVDHGTIMRPTSPTGNDPLDQGNISGDLRDIARSKRIPIVVALQRKQKAIEKKNKKSDISGKAEDIARSDKWVQDCDLLIILHQPEGLNEQDELLYKIVEIRDGEKTSWRAVKNFSNMRITHLNMEDAFTDEVIGQVIE